MMRGTKENVGSLKRVSKGHTSEKTTIGEGTKKTTGGTPLQMKSGHGVLKGTKKGGTHK